MDPKPEESDDPMRALADRLARGEISVEQYREIKAELDSDSRPEVNEQFEIAYVRLTICAALVIVWPVHIAFNWNDIGDQDRIIYVILIGLSVSGGLLLLFRQKAGYYLSNAALVFIWFLGAGIYMTKRDRLFADIDPQFFKEIGRWVLPLAALLYLNLSKRLKYDIFTE